MILRLLKQNGVLGESEYQAALASELNIAGLQRKVDQSVNQPTVFASPTSAQQTTPDRPGSAPGTAEKPSSGEPGNDGTATTPVPSAENRPPEKP
jgi:hypothetical protein